MGSVLMDQHVDEELNGLHQHLVGMARLVQEQLADALLALVHRAPALAREGIEGEDPVIRMGDGISELCITLLARSRPTARDLRLVTTGLNIIPDLERIGDLTVRICEHTLELIAEPPLLPLFDVSAMGEIAGRMVRESIDAFVRQDAALALRVCGAKDEIDALAHQQFRVLLTYMAEDRRTVLRATKQLFIAKCLEGIADHAANICRMVVFMVRGKGIRRATALAEATARTGATRGS